MRPLHGCSAHVSRLLLTAVLLAASSLIVHGQSWTQYDQGTPPQHAAGVSPIGSYISTELGNINLSNGALNITLPMGAAGGRGFNAPISLNYSSKVWSVAHDDTYDPNAKTVGGDPFNPPIGADVPMAYADYGAEESYSDIYSRIAVGWTISGVPLLKGQFVGITGCNAGFVYNLTKLSVVLPDKGEIELRDDQSDGAPLYAGCAPGQYRGQRWHATDGSGAVFISDNDNGIVKGDLNGTLITSDGMRYRFQNTVQVAGANGAQIGRCTSITDRNGNQILINHLIDPQNSNHIETDYVDQLGRTTKVEENAPDPANPAIILPMLVTLKGYQGTPQYYKVKTDLLGNHIRSDFNYNGQPIVTGSQDVFNYCYGGTQPPAWNYLFPTSYCVYQQRIDNQSQVTEVILPDGRSLRFNYNLYGEVAEVLLPTGGKLQYDYSGFMTGFPAGNTLPIEYQGTRNQVSYIDRAVIARRTYPDGATLEGSWTYTYGPQLVNGISYACTEVKAYAGSSSAGTILLDQRHFFLPASRYLTGYRGNATGTGYSLWSTGVEWRTEMLDSTSGVINATEKDWAQRAAVSWTSGYTQEQPANDNRISETRRYLDTGSFAKTDTFYDSLNYPQANNVSEVREYDFDQSLKRRTTNSYVNGSYQTDDSIHLLSLVQQQSVYGGDGTTEVARTVNEYDVYGSDGNHPPLQDYGNVIGHDANFGAGKITRGNLTAVGRWLNNIGATIYSYLGYDTLGNPVSNKDANGNVTTLSYTDDFGDGSNPGGGASGAFGATYAFPTLLTSPPPQTGQPQQTARSQFDFYGGLLTGFKDRNGVITQTLYCRPCDQSNFVSDPFDRPTLVKSALNTGVETHAAMYYAPTTTPQGITLTNNDVLTAKDQNSLDDQVLFSWTRTDGFGRTVQTWSHDPQGDDEVTTVYDALSRAKQVSNPFRPSAGEGAVYSTTAWDLAGRVISVTTPDNAAVTTSYSGNTVTVTDQAGRMRRSITDGLGRLVRVDEPGDPNTNNSLGTTTNPAQPTSYNYDALDNLIAVYQGSQNRLFMYDSLKRLLRARNPEQNINANLNFNDPLTSNSQWCMAYQYDSNGNLTQKTDARGVVANYIYDALNRVTSRSYQNDSTNTPAVTYSYDTTTNGIGRLSSVGSNLSTYSYGGYDALGRATGVTETLGNQNYSVTGVVYDRAGHIKAMTYPSGHSVSYGFDAAGRANDFRGYLGDNSLRVYSTAISYDSSSRWTREQIGTAPPLYNKRHYNIRGQLYDMRLSSVNDDMDGNRGNIANYYNFNNFGFGASGTDNNGNLLIQQHWIPDGAGGYTVHQQNYSYDSLNRISWVGEYLNGSQNTGSQSYSYDRFGNRTMSGAGTGINNQGFSIDANTNRYGVPGGQSGTMTYDSAGNLITDTYSGGGARTYDAENRMISATESNSTYSYDGDGHRVKRNVNGTETWQVYGLGGELLAEYAQNGSALTPQKEYGYRNGELLVTLTSTAGDAHWLVTDQLGTPRMIADQTGSLAGVSRHDYLPFGEELFAGVGGRTQAQGYSANDNVRQKFTQKERDNETGLDYFLARYYSSTQGRFTGVDSYDVNLERQQAENEREAESLFIKFIGNPQRWNHYPYGLNNPVKYVDPNGQEPQDSLELNFERDEKALLSHQITEAEFRSRMNARGVGAAAGLAILATAYIGWEAGMAILMYASTHPEQIEQVTMDLTMASTGSPAPGNPGTLTLAGTTRLTVEEATTGARLATQLGEHLTESSHIGAEFVSAAGKTYDAMGVPAAYAGQNWGSGAKFFESIARHVNKSVDYVAIDLTGATKSQINAIHKYVSTLTKEQQAKIIYVQ